MTTQDLMKPRYKVIADYPNSPSEIGDILDGGDRGWEKAQGDLCAKYPAIFKPLQWWEERERKDMPEFVKSVNGKSFKKAAFYELQKDNPYFMTEINEEAYYLENWLPATKEEYDLYQQSKTLNQ